MRLMRVKKKMAVARRRTTGTKSLREKKLEYHTCGKDIDFRGGCRSGLERD